MKNNFGKISSEKGFSMVEAIIALIVLMVALLAVFSVFTYATIYNTGNSDRSQAMSVLLSEVESVRSLTFSPTFTDTNLTAGTQTKTNVQSGDGSLYSVTTTIVDLDSPTVTLKEVTVTVTQPKTAYAWQTTMEVKSVFRRARSSF